MKTKKLLMRDVPIGSVVFTITNMDNEIRETYYTKISDDVYRHHGCVQGSLVREPDERPRYINVDLTKGAEYPLVPALPIFLRPRLGFLACLSLGISCVTRLHKYSYMNKTDHGLSVSLGQLAVVILTVLLYTVSIVVWGIRLEGRIGVLDVRVAELDHKIGVFEETGSKQSRSQIAVLQQRITEIEKGITPYGVQMLNSRVKDLEDKVHTKIEDSLAKMPLIDQRLNTMDLRLNTAEERGLKTIPTMDRRVTQMEIQLDNLRETGRTVASRRTYEDRW